MKGWYKDVAKRAPPPTRLTLKHITSELVVLYCRIPPLGGNIPIFVETFSVEDLVPTEENIEWMVQRLRSNRSGGPSGMRIDHL